MIGKKILAIVIFLSLGLSAFRPAKSPRPDFNANIINQTLIVVDANGSADYSLFWKFNKQEIQTRISSGISESTFCKEVVTHTGGIIYSQEKHGDAIWCTATNHFTDLKKLENHLVQAFGQQQLTADYASRLTINRLEIKDNTFYLDLAWDNFPCKTPDPAEFSCLFSVQMPGAVARNNASRVDGTTLTWDFSASDTPSTFTAQSAAEGSSSPLWILLAVLLGCCLVIILIGGGIAAYFILRKRKSTPSAPETGADPGSSSPSDPSLRP